MLPHRFRVPIRGHGTRQQASTVVYSTSLNTWRHGEPTPVRLWTRWGKLWVLMLVVAALARAAQAGQTDEAGADKSRYNLFNPTPADQLREMATDGPGATESPYTVDAGHFQIEMSFVDYTSEKDTFDGETYRLDWLAVAPLTLKVGVLNSLDLQLLLEPYNHVYERLDDEYRTTRHGFGDTTLRLKYNVWGNDAGSTALAVMPFVQFPTSQDHLESDIVEAGLIVPFAAELPWDFYLGLTSRFVSAQDILGGEGRHAEFGNSLAVGHQILGDLDGYVEFFSNVSTEREVGWVGTFDTGVIYWLSDNLQLNAGANIGVTKWADDWNLFAGVAWRF